MILSHRHKFIYIKGRKVASTSIEIALSRVCGPDDIITPITPADERQRLQARNYSNNPKAEARWLRRVERGSDKVAKPAKFYNHMSLTEVIDLVGDLSDYQVLFAERSPYAKVLSCLNWRHGRRQYDGQQLKVGDAANLLSDFRESMKRPRNIDLYRMADGSLPSTGWRFESLPASVNAFIEGLGYPPAEFPSAKRGIMADAVDIHDWFGPAQLEMINEYFADEFEAFGYPMVVPQG
ncbi:MAG TPA: hypothetical protein VHD81_12855 [Mycobacteriales bacterium]|nr:hypothetical protein [Mycobacteriales bacterium]